MEETTQTTLGDPCTPPTYTSQALPESPIGSVSSTRVVDAGEGSLSETPWFKHWAEESLKSLDLFALNDHEERVWWRLLAITSVSKARFTVELDYRMLAHPCASTPAKVKAAIATFERRGMVTFAGDTLLINNWQRYQESPQAARMRMKRDRDKTVTEAVTVTRDVTLPVTPPSRAKMNRGTEEKTSNSLRSLDDGSRERLHQHWDESLGKERVEEELLLALNHTASKKYTDMYLYANNWLRRASEWKAERSNGNGRTATPPRKTGPYTTESLREKGLIIE